MGKAYTTTSTQRLEWYWAGWFAIRIAHNPAVSIKLSTLSVSCYDFDRQDCCPSVYLRHYKGYCS